ncbi:antA/AntB antirepressor family protein [Lacticaseibacillus saniviri]|uniref:Phage anti-repressor protein n=1 Tax=Lacticaseibacillus saniviri JCM 17471 = DSM 24301 TaxID=1293598 RepID=A0A0R2MSG7_9LACO|nr:antA/AntB antirepressor family protein [Lacticaseibacillus saniviri]KRO16504.1 hypothetical protein IV56_GL001093 [Lacticaseibacillus saniviri JCM 17471 = DSM 24301]
MNELIETITLQDGTVAVSGRELHDFLGIGKDFSTWFKDMTGYGFDEGIDFSPIPGKTYNGGRPRGEYAMTLDMAKEVSMIQRNEKGKQARQYFIEVEKRAKQIELPQTPEEKLILTMQVSARTIKRVEKLDARVTDLEENQPLSGSQYAYISRLVSRAVVQYIETQKLLLTSKQRGMFYRDISRGLNDFLGVRTRTQIRIGQFDKACEFIENWTPSTSVKMKLRDMGGAVQEVGFEI